MRATEQDQAVAVGIGEATIAASPRSAFDLRNLAQKLCDSDLFRKVSETYATQIFNIALSLATTILITRAIGPSGRGLYSVAMAIGALGVHLSNAGLHFSNTYYVARDRNLLPSLIGNSLFISLGLGGLAAAVGWIVFSVKPEWAPLQGVPLAIGLLWIPIGLAMMLTQALLLGIHEVRSYNVVEALNRITALVLAVAIVVAGRPHVEWFLVTGVAALVLSLGAGLLRLARCADRWPRLSLSVLRQNLPVGLKAYFILLLSFLVLRVDLLIVKYLLGAEQAGYYSVAAAMADNCLVLPIACSTILFPKLCGLVDVKEKAVLTWRAGLGTAAGLGLILVVASVLAAPLVSLAFGKAFLPAVAAFIWLTPGLLTLGVEIVIVQFLNSLGIPNVVIGVWVLSAVTNIMGNLWAIPRFGIVGASVVSSVTYSLTFVLVVLMIVRTVRRLAES
jgi:O-antigen/teichoic acid export membrane protein